MLGAAVAVAEPRVFLRRGRKARRTACGAEQAERLLAVDVECARGRAAQRSARRNWPSITPRAAPRGGRAGRARRRRAARARRGGSRPRSGRAATWNGSCAEPRNPATWPGSWTTLYITCGRATNVGRPGASGSRVAQDRAEARRVVAVVAQELQVPLERVAAAEGRERRRVVVRHRVVHAADDRQPVHHPGRVRQVLADPDARHARRDRAELAADLARGVRLHVPGVEVARPAVVEDQDARPDRRSMPPPWRRAPRPGSRPARFSPSAPRPPILNRLRRPRSGDDGWNRAILSMTASSPPRGSGLREIFHTAPWQSWPDDATIRSTSHGTCTGEETSQTRRRLERLPPRRGRAMFNQSLTSHDNAWGVADASARRRWTAGTKTRAALELQRPKSAPRDLLDETRLRWGMASARTRRSWRWKAGRAGDGADLSSEHEHDLPREHLRRRVLRARAPGGRLHDLPLAVRDAVRRGGRPAGAVQPRAPRQRAWGSTAGTATRRSRRRRSRASRRRRRA